MYVYIHTLKLSVFKINLLFLVALGLCCFKWAFSSCSKRGLVFVVVHELLMAVASLIA